MAAQGVTYPVPKPTSGPTVQIVPAVIAPLTATEAPAGSTVKQLAALGAG